jgi:hypothetical protein
VEGQCWKSGKSSPKVTVFELFARDRSQVVIGIVDKFAESMAISPEKPTIG